MKRPHADREVGRGPHSPPLAALVLITATGPFCTDTYLAALPELRSAFGTTVSAVQLTITACIVGLALGLLTGGSLSDSVGRRPLLLASTLLFVVTSAVAGMSSNIGLLIALRVLQGASAGAGASIGRAIVSDCWSGTAAARRFGTLGAIGLLAPISAPAIGGLILSHFDWRCVFAFMTALGLAQVAIVATLVPETLAVKNRHTELRDLLKRAMQLVSQHRYRRAVEIQCLATAGFFVYIGGSSFVLRNNYSLTATEYSSIFAVNATGLLVCSILFRLMVSRVSSRRLRSIGTCMSAGAAILLGVLALLSGGNPPIGTACVLIFLSVSGNGFTQIRPSACRPSSDSSGPSRCRISLRHWCRASRERTESIPHSNTTVRPSLLTTLSSRCACTALESTARST
ncbi:Bcr/CflA family efflux MFS transporter [Brachybacterium kimchii]|uniref:Bcr/CflA family efflux MFS transporter n=1 Tax=Brachybacterium kimchii TaxID=2942909 RepID=UPI003D1D7FBA